MKATREEIPKRIFDLVAKKFAIGEISDFCWNGARRCRLINIYFCGRKNAIGLYCSERENIFFLLFKSIEEIEEREPIKLIEKAVCISYDFKGFKVINKVSLGIFSNIDSVMKEMICLIINWAQKMIYKEKKTLIVNKNIVGKIREKAA